MAKTRRSPDPLLLVESFFWGDDFLDKFVNDASNSCDSFLSWEIFRSLKPFGIQRNSAISTAPLLSKMASGAKLQGGRQMKNSPPC